MHLESLRVDTVRIAALLQPFLTRTLPELALDQISTYIDLLLRWKARINLTAVRDPDDIVTRHFGESLFLARQLFPDAPVPGVGRTLLSAKPSLHPGSILKMSEVRALDIGSGAGFPGIPLKIWAPAIHLTLIESNHKKAAFLREVARELRLTDIDVMTERAETLAARPDFPPANLVTFRAVEHFESILPLATRFLAPSGRLALLVGTSQLPTLASLSPEIRWATPIALPNSGARVLSIGSN